MTSSTERPDDVSVDASVEEAERLVVAGYDRIHRFFKTEKLRGEVSEGTLLVEVLHKLHSVPPLLTADEFVKFRKAADIHTAEDVIAVLWDILENVCKEGRLMPVITGEREHGRVVVILI